VALDALIRNICNPAEAVLIATPYWSGLDISVSIQNEAQVIRVDVPLNRLFDTSVVDLYNHALLSSPVPVRAILVTNPHNPLGRCFPRDVLEALIQFCVDHNLHFISDEVYATSIYHSREEWERYGEGPYHPFFSVLSLVSPESLASKLVHVVYSVSKDFGVSGLRLVSLASTAYLLKA
jgi:aspartate/methionine/tyrosine aminotransferase